MQNLTPRLWRERAESFLHPTRMTSSAILSPMDAVALTRQLVDIESITGNEAQVGEFLYRELCSLGLITKTAEFAVEKFSDLSLVAGDRFDVDKLARERNGIHGGENSRRSHSRRMQEGFRSLSPQTRSQILHSDFLILMLCV